MAVELRRMRDRSLRAALLVGVGAMAMSFGGASALAGRATPAGGAGMDPERIRQALKAHTLRTVEGRTLALNSLRGEVVVVNFWASWCTPCRKELPRLDALHRSIAGRGGRVLAVSIDQEARNVGRFTKTHRLSLPVYHDGPDGLARTLDLPHIPFTIVLDRDGSVALTTAGADDAALEAIAATTRRLMAAAPAASPTVVAEAP
jgi:cytochrome c biogenesis protein CcmG, thiol:disulfide interchange protein DsbE